ncbi:MAG: copper chaperone PCu(A)C, partial [Magnetococcales bacterium]|nr:copper chaperone PCu(A)C [Magnetococcales bacterium]
MKKFVLLTFALFFGLVSVPAFAGGIQVEGAWIRAAPPSVKVLAAYMTIKNSGSISKTVVGAHSPQFAKVEFHESLIRNGMATMIARDSLALSPGGEVILSPGGYHMMLIGPQRIIRKGDKIAIIMHFSDGSNYKVIANVMKSKGKAMDHSTMDHSTMDHSNMNYSSPGMMSQQMMSPNSSMMPQQMMNQQQSMMQHQGMMQHMDMMGYETSKGASCPMMQNKPGMQCKKMHMQKNGSCGVCNKNGKMKHENCTCKKDGKMKHESCTCKKD